MKKNENLRILLICSGSSHEKVFDICYNMANVIDIILFTSNAYNFKSVKKNYSKVYRVIDKIKNLIESIQEIFLISNNISNSI